MGVTELILLIAGGIVFTISFFLPGGKKDEDGTDYPDEEKIRELIEREMKDAKTQIGDIVDETIQYSMEKTERSMDRLTNEKMKAVNEFSDTVLEQIEKNHKEAVFLYDMLNDKHENLINTVSEVTKKEAEVKQTMLDVEITAREVSSRVADVQSQLESAEEASPEAAAEEFVPIQAPVLEIQTLPEPEPLKSDLQPEEKEEEKKTTKRKSGRKKPDDLVSKIDMSMAAPVKNGGRNNNERILELHKAGKSNMAIAKELGLGIGEVKLVIDLFEGV